MEITRFLARQGLLFRASHENDHNSNQLVNKFDPFLSKYVPSLNVTYAYSESQNELITCCAEATLKVISQEMRASGVFSIMADETRNGNKKLLAICVHYLHKENIKECFLGFVQLLKFNTVALNEAIQTFLQLT